MNADIFTSIALHLSTDDVVRLCKSTHVYLNIYTRQFWHRYFSHHNQILYDIGRVPNLLEYKLLFDFNPIIPYIQQYYPNDDVMTILRKMHTYYFMEK